MKLWETVALRDQALKQALLTVLPNNPELLEAVNLALQKGEADWRTALGTIGVSDRVLGELGNVLERAEIVPGEGVATPHTYVVERGPQVRMHFDHHRLRQARIHADLTQGDLADRAGISVTTIRRAERGAAISLDTAYSIGAALNIPAEQLLLPSPAVMDPLPTQGAGPHLGIGASGRIVQAAPSAIDAQGNNIRRMQQLLPLVREAADDLATRLNPKDNAFSELVRDIERYRRYIAGDESEIAWGLIWGLSVRLEETATAAERMIADQIAPSLDDATLAALQSLRSLHAPLILATAEGRELQEQADRLHMTREERVALREDALILSSNLQRSEEIIEPEAASIVGEAADAIGEGRHPERGTMFGIATIKNTSIVLIGAALIVTPSQFIGGVVGAGLTMGAWEAIKKSPIFAAATAALGEEFNQLIQSGGTAASSWLPRLLPFRGFVQTNEPHLRRIAASTPQLRWMLPYIDYIMRQDKL